MVLPVTKLRRPAKLIITVSFQINYACLTGDLQIFIVSLSANKERAVPVKSKFLPSSS